MRTAIVGCGAMGTVMGAYLAKSGCDVDLVDANEAHVAAMNDKGAHITGCVDVTVPVKAITPRRMEGKYDIVFLLTKQTSNKVVLTNLLPYLNEDSTVCTLQNGVPEAFVADYIGEKRTVGGTVLWGATYVEPGVSELTQDVSKSSCLFEIGEISGEITPRIQAVAEVLRLMGSTQITTSLLDSRWSKLVFNASMSGMSAACGCTFGQVLDNETAYDCLCYIGHEVKLCCEAQGYHLHDEASRVLALGNKALFQESRQFFFDMYDRQRSAKASMLQDLEHDRATEVHMINGYVCKVGDQYGIDTYFNDTVEEIVSKIEAHELPLSMDNLRFFNKSKFLY